MSASITLASFARNPRKALRRLPADGLVLTRPGEPALRVVLDGSVHSSSTTSSAAVAPASGTDIPAAHDTHVETPDTAESVRSDRNAAVRNDRGDGDDVGPGDPVEAAAPAADDLAQAALALLPKTQFLALVRERHPWLESLPPAARRMALAEVEQARAASGASPRAIEKTLRGWRERSAPFTA